MAKIIFDSMTQKKMEARRRNISYPDLEEYIQKNYKTVLTGMVDGISPVLRPAQPEPFRKQSSERGFCGVKPQGAFPRDVEPCDEGLVDFGINIPMGYPTSRDVDDRRNDTEEFRVCGAGLSVSTYAEEDEETQIETELQERMKHLSDSFSEYLLYMIKTKHLQNADVYKNALVDKKVFSKIKNNSDYHPNKLTAMSLCVGMCLNLDETKDLLARAGYALSSCDKTDVIFSYFIEKEIYDMYEIDIQLENHGLPCIIK